MDEVLLNGKEIENISAEDLPMLIYGEDKSGASFYTVCLAAKWFLQGNKVIFLCGYHMAQESFEEQAGKEHDGAVFYTKEKAQEQDFKKAVSKGIINNTLLVIKNVELFGSEEIGWVSSFKNVIISGDILKSKANDEILKKEFSTKVYFSKFAGVDMPDLAKYEGFMVSDRRKGITKIKISQVNTH